MECDSIQICGLPGELATVMLSGKLPKRNLAYLELGIHIKGYDCTGSTPVREIAQLPAGDGDPEGDLDGGNAMALTNNGYCMAGELSFGGSLPTGELTIMRICPFGSSGASLSAIETALTYISNNQTALFGGPCVIAISYGVAYPEEPLWANETLAYLATTLFNQGTQVCMSAGDTPGTYLERPATSTGRIAVVQVI